MRGHHTTNDAPAIPELEVVEETFGTNPLRWLWTRSVSGKERPGCGDGQELDTAFAIIAGLSDRWELACWYWAEQVTRQRSHVIDRLRRRDVAIVEDTRRFADTTLYPWERDESATGPAGADGEVVA